MDEKTPYERLIEGVNQLAQLIKAYCDALVAQGFSHEDALFLCAEYQKEIMRVAKAMSDKDKKQ